MKRKRIIYLLIGGTMTPMLLFLGITLIPESDGPWALWIFSALFFSMAIAPASAIRAAFRTPPWWIVPPEEILKSEISMTRRNVEWKIHQAEKLLKNIQEDLRDLHEKEQGGDPVDVNG